MSSITMTVQLEGSPHDLASFLQRSLGTNRFRKRVTDSLKAQPQLLTTERPRCMKLTQGVYQTIVQDLSRLRNEQGAILIGPPDDEELVDEIVLDRWGHGSPIHFEFDATKLNQILRRCIAEGRDCRGFIHNHPAGLGLLSNGDIDYVKKVFAMNEDVPSFYMPIFVDGVIEPFIVNRQNPDCPEHTDIQLVKEKR